jgi:uncharacterized LabA/DUF88 family protein
MTERSRRVVLLIDYDNLQICAARDTPGRDLQLPPVVQLAQRYGTVILARAYAEWNLSTERLAVYKAGIEPAFAPVLRTESDRSGKSLADTVMVAEGMDMLWTLSPEVVVLATSDKDLIPLVRVAKQRGAFVVVLGSDFTAIPLREMADEHVTYRQLITEAGLRYATEAGPGRQPAALPEPSRRRRDRNGRERTAAAATPATGTPSTPSTATPSAAPSRPERESAPAAHAPAAHAEAATEGAEPVAPVASGGEGETQTTGRRRRRRGSRRRSDRVGTSGEYAGGTESEGADGEHEPGEEPITPTTSAVDVEVGMEPVVGLTAEPEPEIPAEVVEAVAAPAPRERRRRTTRRTTAAAEATAAPTPADEPEQAPAAPAVVPVVPEQSADIPPAPPPETSVNGASSEVSEEGEAAAAPAPRRRRVASASRGRSRRP